jgi:hypothetical protein
MKGFTFIYRREITERETAFYEEEKLLEFNSY